MANPDHEAIFRRVSSAPAAAPKEGADTRPAADLSGFDLSNILGTSARLCGATLHHADLRKAALSGAYLSGADLSHANLSSAILATADLRQVKMSSANLKGADLNSAVLCGADLRDANLTRCALTRADLTHADLGGADLTKTDLRGARGLTAEQIRAARNWQQAVLDPATAQRLGLADQARTSRQAPGKERSKAVSSKESVEVDIRFHDRLRVAFGDLFTLTGGRHPQFPPGGDIDLAPLARLGFQQLDDFFAIAAPEPVVWLYPLIRGQPVTHHPGPFKAIRLAWTPTDPKDAGTAPAFLQAVAALLESTRGTAHDPQTGHPTSPESLTAACTALALGRSRRPRRG